MQYAMLIYETPEAFEWRTGGEDGAYVGAWRAYHHAMVKAGVYVGGDPLQLPDTATTVRMKADTRHILDGPYAETKEQLGGFVLVEVGSHDEALEWAARCPAASYGAVEVRPVAVEMKMRVTGAPRDATQEGSSQR
jgi:hypothetical protein